VAVQRLDGVHDGELFRPLFQWRVSFVWYAVALLLPLAVTMATLALSGGFTAHFSKFGAPLAILTSFLSYLLAAIPEEIAWRGFALPRLQARHNALTASLIVGLLWAIWHLPLLLNTNNSMSTYPIGLFVVDVLADSIIYAWIYNNTRGSLLFVTLFHAVGNTIGTFTGIESVLVNVALALVIVLVFGATHLSRSKRPTEDSAPIEPIPAD
jgi:membrane protease YdiL (CAAX protease family)